VTIPASSAPAARQWLFEQCSAALVADPLDKNARLGVYMDEPGTPDQPEDIVDINDIQNKFDTNALVGGGGAGWLNESFTISVDVSVFRGGDDAQAVSARAYTLAAQIIALVRADPTMGNTVLIAKPSGATYTGAPTEDHMGRTGNLSLTFDAFQVV
jgi:hypothetical protein